MTRPSPVTRFVVFLLLNAACWFSPSAFPQAAGALAMTPPMGWNSWNKFGCNVSDKLIREMADAMVSSGMKALANNVDSKGLKLGIYTDAGTGTCEKRPGSLNHEVQDAKTYASWGIDYVKIDWCNAEGLDPEVQYAKFPKRHTFWRLAL